MAEIPPAESIDDALQRAADAVNALKRAKPATVAEARIRSAKANAIEKQLKSASRQAEIDSLVAAGTVRKANGAGHGGRGDDTLVQLAQGFVPLAELAIQLLERVTRLEALPLLTDGEIWREGKSYRRGAACTHSGLLWVAKRNNSNATPGKSDDWRLMAKSHR